jgi:hypothetical protein
VLMAPFFPTAGVLPNMKKYSIVGLVAGVVVDRYSGASPTVDSDPPKLYSMYHKAHISLISRYVGFALVFNSAALLFSHFSRHPRRSSSDTPMNPDHVANQQELLAPWMFGALTLPDQAHILIMGSSMGGLVSLYGLIE